MQDEVFYNLILKERRYAILMGSLLVQPVLCDDLRHSILSWMLRVCEHEKCQDEIYALATMILDNFLAIHPTLLKQDNSLVHQQHQQHHNECQIQCQIQAQCFQEKHMRQQKLVRILTKLEQRQLVLFAACSLLLATKLRQTQRLYIQTLIEFSKCELPCELTRAELIEGELLMLSLLKWDLAALVTPNEFLQELLTKKCRRLVINLIENNNNNNIGISNQSMRSHQRKEEQMQQQVPMIKMDQDEVDDNQLMMVVAARAAAGGGEIDDDDAGHYHDYHTHFYHPHHYQRLPAHHHHPHHHHSHRRRQQQQNHRQSSNNNHRHHLKNLTNNNGQQQQQQQQHHSSNKCKLNRVNGHAQTLLELILMDHHLSQYPPSILAMASMAIAIDTLIGASNRLATSQLNNILEQIHESTGRVNEMKLMIDVADQIEDYFEKLCRKTFPAPGKQ